MEPTTEAVTLANENNVEEETSVEVSNKEDTKQDEYKVFVGNLAFSTSEQALSDFFNKTGKV